MDCLEGQEKGRNPNSFDDWIKRPTMTGKRLLQTIVLNLQRGANARGAWLKKKGIFAEIGNDVRFQIRTVPLYPELIKIGSNVNISSGVALVTHDAMHMVHNKLPNISKQLKEKVQCIEIGDNVFIGANCTILGNVKIESNVIISANSLVNKDCETNSIYGGVPAKKIGSFDKLWEERIKETYPTVNNNQAITEEEAKLAWKTFYAKRADE